ncbi:MAG: hypothetical protein AAGE52_00410 [Myxococcota bacterium]
MTARWLLVALLSGCGGDDDAPVDAGARDAAPPDGSDASTEPAAFWYVQTTIASPEGRTSYLQLVDEIEGRTIGTENAVELPGNARVFVQGNRVFTGSAEEPVLQRWFPQADGSLEPGERISLAALGLSFIPFGNNFISDDKAYLFDGSGGIRVVIWDPAALEIGDQIDLRPLMKPDFLPEIDPGVLRDDLLFVVVQQQDFAGGFFPGIQVAVFNTATDEIEAVIEDERCVGGFSGMALAEDGSIYVFGDNYLVRQWFDDELPPSCLLRIPPDELAFDPAFFVDFNEAAGGLPCTGLFYRGDGKFLTTAMDESLGSVDPRDAPLTFLNEPVSYWVEVDINNLSASRRLDLDAVSPRTGPGFEVGDRQFIQRPEAAFTGNNTLIEIAEDESLIEIFQTTGLITGFGRVEVER